MVFDVGPHLDFALRTTSLRNHPTVNEGRRHQRKRFSHRLSTRPFSNSNGRALLKRTDLRARCGSSVGVRIVRGKRFGRLLNAV